MTFTIKNPTDRKHEADKAVEAIKIASEVIASKNVHPTERVDVYRRIEKWAGQKAVEQEKINDRDGVPE